MSKTTLGNYAKTANDARAHEKDDHKADNRGTGVMKALDKLAGKKSGPLKGAAVTARFSNANGLHNAAKDRETFNRKVDRKVAESVDESEHKPGDIVHHVPGVSMVKKGDKGFQVHRVTGPTTSHHIDTYDSKEHAIHVANSLKESEELDESFANGKTVYTSHTDKVLKGVVVSKDDDNKDQYIVKHKDGNHSVHKDHIHSSATHAGYMQESTSHQAKTTIKGIKNPDVTQRMAAHDIKPGIKGYADRIALLRDAKAKGNLKETELEESSPFDWKKTKSEIDWNDDNKKSAEGGSVHKARTAARNAEGGALVKKSVGRPTGKHDGYKIDRAERDDPKNKEALSKKVMAAKAQGFKDRGEFTSIVNRGLAQKQLKDAGLNPDDHKAAIEKQVKKAAGKFYSPHGQ